MAYRQGLHNNINKTVSVVLFVLLMLFWLRGRGISTVVLY